MTRTDSSLGAVAVAPVAALAQVAEVVEQRGHDPERKTGSGQGRRAIAAALVAVHEARHGERDVEHVLDVVVLGIAGLVVRMLAGIEPAQVFERALDGLRGRHARGRPVVEGVIHAQHLPGHVPLVGRANRVGDVVVAATHGARSLLPGKYYRMREDRRARDEGFHTRNAAASRQIRHK